jgi:hypothetical protein
MSRRYSDLFPDNHTTRALFEEPTHRLERLDPWEGPAGFMIGGMANLSYEQAAEAYFDAATILLHSVQDKTTEDYRVSLPVLFLYRHSLELLIKETLPKPARGHNLWVLYQQFINVMRDVDVEIPEWVGRRIEELNRVDPTSTVFRYSKSRDKDKKVDLPIDGELHVDLAHLKAEMTALKTGFLRAAAALACARA